MMRICSDCGDEYKARADRKSQECPPCKAQLIKDGVDKVKQPAAPDTYTPRYNGTRFYEERDANE